VTDAPLDHEGKGRDFSPTDLVAAALGSCIITVMGIKARKENWPLNDLKLEVNKKMSSMGLRKIETLSIQIFMPSNLSNRQLRVLQNETENCPVTRNIQGSTNIRIIWNKLTEDSKCV